MSGKHQSINKWGETIYQVPFVHHRDAKNFTRFIGRNFRKFALIGCHKAHGSTWVVVYRSRRTYPWKEGVA